MDYLDELEKPYVLNEEQIKFYQKNKFIKLKKVFSHSTIAYINEAISKKVEELNRNPIPLSERDTYGKAFLQLMNLWREDPAIERIMKSKRLGKIAADLMQIEGVRLYHDQALFKEGGGGITPWHADQYYWPLSNNNTITAWIPLQATPLKMGPLEFSAGSHQIEFGRDLQIGDQSEKAIKDKLRVTDFPHIIEPFDMGEISFHSGWIFHRAGANKTSETRKVFTIIYMDKNMKLISPENKNQENDWKTWCPGVKVGETIDSPINPIIFP